MNRTMFFRLTSLVLSVILVHDSIGAFERSQHFTTPKKETTFLVYIAGDNDLADYINPDIQEMERIGSTNLLNILIYLNTTTPEQGKVTKKLFVQPGKTIQVGDDEARDSGDAQTLIDACAWAHTDFPSNKFIVVLWDHGSGSVNRNGLKTRSWLWHPEEGNVMDSLDDENSRAVCYDDTTGNYLTDDKLIHAFSTVCNQYRQGKKIDIIAFDACLMGTVEVAFTLEPFTRYMVASEENIPGYGFGYQHVLRQVASKKISMSQLARNMTTGYKLEYNGRVPDFTLSALDLAWLKPVVNNINEVSRLLIDLLGDENSGSEVYIAITKSVHDHYCTYFSDETYLDIGSLYQNLTANIIELEVSDTDKKQELLTTLAEGQQHLRNCVIANVFGRSYSSTSGLSVYFMRKRIDSTYPGLYWSKNTAWLSFLDAYTKHQRMLSRFFPLDFVF